MKEEKAPMDNGLRKAIEQQATPRLASNFTYRTLKRIQTEMARREARRERFQYRMTLLASAFLMVVGVGLMVWSGYPMQWLSALHDQFSPKEDLVFIPILVSFIVLPAFDFWLHRRFRRKKQ